MYGYIEWTKEMRRPALTEREILHLRFRCAAIPQRKGMPQMIQRRLAARAAKLLHREGIVRAVFPEAFPWLELFAQHHIYPADTMVLCRALAAELVQARLDASGQMGKGVTVAVCTRRLTEEVRRTVTELCIRNRYVMLAAPERDDGFCRKLRREYGVPLLQTEHAEQLAKAAVMVRFSPEIKCAEAQDVIDLFHGGTPLSETLCLSPELDTQIPNECDRMQLLAALHSAGAIRPGQIRILYGQSQK